jgi:hypothetical protein
VERSRASIDSAIATPDFGLIENRIELDSLLPIADFLAY